MIKLDNTVVNVTTQEEWDKVTTYYEIIWNVSSWDNHKENSCINPTTLSYANREFYKNNKYTIISFKKWLEKTGQQLEYLTKYDLLPDTWYKAISETKNFIVYNKYFVNKKDTTNKGNGFSHNDYKYLLATQEEIDYAKKHLSKVFNADKFEPKDESDFEFKVDKWYIHKNYKNLLNKNLLICPKVINNSKHIEKIIGFADRNWINHDNWHPHKPDYRPATDYEVKDALMKYANKHYKDGDVVESTSTKGCRETIDGNKSIRFTNLGNQNKFNIYANDGGIQIFNFNEGKWAEKVSSYTKTSIEFKGVDNKFTKIDDNYSIKSDKIVESKPKPSFIKIYTKIEPIEKKELVTIKTFERKSFIKINN